MTADAPTKVIHVVRALEMGGLETLVLETCVRMRRDHGVEASVFALLPGDGLEKRPLYRDVPSTVVSTDGRATLLAAAARLMRLFGRERPDVVHVHNFFSQVRAAPAAKGARVPVVIHTKHGAQYPAVWGSRQVAAGIYGLANVVVAVSDDVYDGLMCNYAFRPGKVRRILNGIDIDRFRPLPRSQVLVRRRAFGLRGAPLVGTVCRLSAEKGVPTLLEGFAQLCEVLPEACLVVVGDGAERRTCEMRTRELGLDSRTYFLGARDDVSEIYPLLDVYVQPSYTEGVALTVLEACACALPAAVTAVGGNTQIVQDGQSGRLVPPHDASALAEAIREIWADREAASAMGRAARRRVVEAFSLDRMVREYLALYRELLAKKARMRAQAADGSC